MKNGIFTISLDFELYWGVSESRTIEEYEENLRGTRTAIRGMLSLFSEYGMHVTWATVGMLFCKNKEELLERCEKVIKPGYRRPRLSNYDILKNVGKDHTETPYYFGSDILPLIQEVPYQEVGTHTFAHFYAMEDGQTIEAFRSDLLAAIDVAAANGIRISSIVFPRNQYTPEHLAVCYELGITNYRANEKHRIYQPVCSNERRLDHKLLRGLDVYFNVSGDNTHELQTHDGSHIYKVPSSRFFRPYKRKLSFLEKIRIRRITEEMELAAKNKKMYHLWWHPHNFGKDVEINLGNLRQVLEHFTRLKELYEFESLNMGEITNKFLSKNG